MRLPFEGCVLREYPYGSVTQWFGENASLYRPWGLKAHNGIDLVAPYGTPLCAIEAGIIINVKSDPNGYGRHLRILSTASTEGIHREWTYGHLASISVKVGQKVKEGQEVGKMGNSGFVQSGKNVWWGDNQPEDGAGTHLHLGLRFVRKDRNGFSYTKDGPRLEVLNYDNGYKGAVDPRPILTPDTETQLAIIERLRKVVELYKQLVKTK
jgi:murein DD-endopeptidase MepM/ murein hydrolase activator NlpD